MTEPSDVSPPDPPLPEQPSLAFNGWLEETSLADLVQLACLEGAERCLLVQHQGCEGQIFFSGGDVVHAIASGRTGQEAFFEILSWPAGSFRLCRQAVRERSIQTSWNFLLIEALRQDDERREGLAEGRDRALRVLVVDDSPVVCRMMRQMLGEDSEIEVVAEAYNGRQALEMIGVHRPDILTLDVNMPVMGGDLALMHIMIRSPAPVVLVSGLSSEGATRVMEFLRLGAVDFVPKPQKAEDWATAASRLRRSLRFARDFQVQRIRRARTPRPVVSKAPPGGPATRLVIMVGGLGGLLEVQKILPAMPWNPLTAVLVIQEMVGELATPLAKYLDRNSQLTVSSLDSGGPLLSGQCCVSGWQEGWSVVKEDGGAAVRKAATGGLDIVHLFTSASEVFGPRLCVVVLSGTDLDMGECVRIVAARGGRILLQDPESSLASGPVRSVLASGLAGESVLSETVARVLAQWARDP